MSNINRVTNKFPTSGFLSLPRPAIVRQRTWPSFKLVTVHSGKRKKEHIASGFSEPWTEIWISWNDYKGVRDRAILDSRTRLICITEGAKCSSSLSLVMCKRELWCREWCRCTYQEKVQKLGGNCACVVRLRDTFASIPLVHDCLFTDK